VLKGLKKSLKYKEMLNVKQKSNKKINGQNHPRGDRKQRPKKGQKRRSPTGPKRGRELVSLMVGSYVTHSPSNVANM
jgi:hypothetical protein